MFEHRFSVAMRTEGPITQDDADRLGKAVEATLGFCVNLRDFEFTKLPEPRGRIPDEVVAAFLWCVRQSAQDVEVDEEKALSIASLAYHYFTKAGFVMGEVEASEVRAHPLPKSAFRIVGGTDTERST